MREMASEIQESITDVLVKKTLTAAAQFKVKSILLGGGVTANKRLKEKLSAQIIASKLDIDLFIPKPELCTDNAAYIAAFAFFHYNPKPWQKIQAKPNLEVDV